MARKDINFNTYVERDLQKTTVDWGTVANKLTGDLLKIREERAAERDKIAQDTIEATDKVNKMEEYSSQTLQNLALGMSGDSAEFLRVQQDLFNRGLISQTELAQNKQRVLGDWQQFGNISKRWESDYANMVKRAEDGDASTFEVWLNQQNAEFGNLKGVTGFVNPQTGTLSLLRRDGDGKVSSDPSRHVSLNQMQNRFNTQIQNVSKDNAIDKNLKDSVDQLGKLVIAKLTTNDKGENDGGVLSVEGQKQAMESDEIKKYINGTVNGYLSNDYKIFSVLGDVVGEDKNGNKYEPTTSLAEAKKDPSKVLVRYDESTGMAVPINDAPNWEAQKGVAEEAVKNRMLVMLDDVSSIKPGDKDMNNYQKELIALKKRQLNQNDEDVNNAIDDEYNLIKYRGPVFNRDASEKQLMGGDKASVYIYKNLGEQIDGVVFNDPDSNVYKTFNNVIQSVLDENIFNDLEKGNYPNDRKPFNIDYRDDGSDRLILELGKEKIIYPPLRSSLKQVDNYKTNPEYEQVLTVDEKMITDDEQKLLDSGTIPKGFYGIDTSGNGKIDKILKGLGDYKEDGAGANNKYYHNTKEMFDYVKRNLIIPADKDLRQLQKSNYDAKANKSKRNNPEGELD